MVWYVHVALHGALLDGCPFHDALRSAQLIWSTATERLSSDLIAYFDVSIGWFLVALHGFLICYLSHLLVSFTRQKFL